MTGRTWTYCILGPHWSHRPRHTRTTESAVRSRSEKTRVSSRLTPGAPRSSARSDEANGVGNLRGNVPEQSLNQVCVGIDDDDGVAVPARRLLIHLVSHEVVHEGGLAHAGAGGVEVVASQQVVGEADLPGIARSGLSHQRAAHDAPGGRSKRPRSRPLHQGRLVTCSRRVPQGRRLTHPYDAAPAEQSGPSG